MMIFPLRTALFSLLASVGLASAAAVNLSGTIYDKDNKPLPGVIVSLSKGGLIDTTGADGKWQLLGASTGISRIASVPTARWDGKVLSLNLIAPATVQVESFDVKGARLGMLAQARLEAGNHSLPVGSAQAATGMRWLRLSVDGKTQVIATGSGTKVDQVALPGPLARSAADTVEQIIYTLQGQLISADTVLNLIQSGLDKWIQEFSVSGKVTADPRVLVDTVFAWFDGGRMTGMRRGRMGYNKANSAYSGRIFTVKSLTGDVFNYRVWLNVMANGNRRTGISDTTDFSSDFGAIDFIPLYSVGNAIPSGSITGPVAGLVNTKLSYGLSLTRKDESLAHMEWDFGDGKGFTAGKDTITGLWLQPGSYSVQARLTDIDSNTATLTKTVNITNVGAVVAGLRDTTITPSDVVVFSMTASDTDGIAKVLWSFGDGSTDSTFTGTTHTASHKYPGTGIVTAGTSKVYSLTITVVDKLGNTTPQTAQITVFNDIPVVAVHDTVGEPDSLVTLHAKATDRGTVVGYEWSLDGTTFKAGGKDTTIKLPAAPTLNYPVYARAIDEDGNVSKVDTIKVIAGKMITDTRDGQRYRIVTIGTQTWMAQNLNYKVDSSWWYNNSADSGAKYGRLYNWASAMGLNDSCNTKSCANQVEPQHKGVCPIGWHVPDTSEWGQLIRFTESDPRVGIGNSANALRSSRGWLTGATNSDLFGFSILAAGARSSQFYGTSEQSEMWTSNESDPTNSWRSNLYTSRSNIALGNTRAGNDAKMFGQSIRCIQDILSVSVRDTIVEIGSTIILHAMAKGAAGRSIEKIEWSIDGGAFATGSSDTAISAPAKQTLKYIVLVRVTEKMGRVSEIDTAKIDIYQYIEDKRDGQRYPVVVVGNQVWMAKNLNFNAPKSLWYNDNPRFGKEYGKLYDWASSLAIDDSCNAKLCGSSLSSQNQGVCIPGWHIPSLSEWSTLDSFASSESKKIGQKSDTCLISLSDGGVDLFGMNIRLAGNASNSTFDGMGRSTIFNSSFEDPYNSNVAGISYIGGMGRLYVTQGGGKLTGKSVRCIKDVP